MFLIDMFGDLVHKSAADVKKMSTFTAFKMVMHMAGIFCSDILIAAWAAFFDCIFSDFSLGKHFVKITIDR